MPNDVRRVHCFVFTRRFAFNGRVWASVLWPWVAKGCVWRDAAAKFMILTCIASRFGAELNAHMTRWKTATYIGMIPVWVCIGGGLYAIVKGEHHDQGPKPQYAYAKIRTKEYPWSNGDCNLFDMHCRRLARLAASGKAVGTSEAHGAH